MVQDIGQRDIFCLEGLSLLLEFVCQADSPALLRHAISRLLGDILAHEVRCGLLAPLCGHFSGTRSTGGLTGVKRRYLGVRTGSRPNLLLSTTESVYGAVTIRR